MSPTDDIFETGLEPQDLPMPSEQLDSFDPVKTDLGKVVPVLRGGYSSSETYTYLDIVTYSGRSYICRNDNTRGILPTNTSYWMLLVDAGGALPKGGGTMSGPLDMNGNRLTGLGGESVFTALYKMESLNQAQRNGEFRYNLKESYWNSEEDTREYFNNVKKAHRICFARLYSNTSSSPTVREPGVYRGIIPFVAVSNSINDVTLVGFGLVSMGMAYSKIKYDGTNSEDVFSNTLTVQDFPFPIRITGTISSNAFAPNNLGVFAGAVDTDVAMDFDELKYAIDQSPLYFAAIDSNMWLEFF